MYDTKKEFAESLRKQYGCSLLNKNSAAQELNVSRATLDRMRQQGEIKSQKISKQIKFHVSEIARLVIS